MTKSDNSNVVGPRVREGEEEDDEDCPLCLLPLDAHDRAHPMQCPTRHCHFNCEFRTFLPQDRDCFLGHPPREHTRVRYSTPFFPPTHSHDEFVMYTPARAGCMGCLENMISATKDDAISVASDGNAFRVFLHCPNCRGNLGPSIRDTVLLRKVDKYRAGIIGGGGGSCGGDLHSVHDDVLPASELRLKKALEDDVGDVASAINEAKRREDEFFSCRRDPRDDGGVGASAREGARRWRSESIRSFDDEEGFEADLDGPHTSFVCRHHSHEIAVKEEEEVDIENVEPDPTLLFGLDAFVTDEEQRYLTAQLTSGDPLKLAATAEMMHYVSAMSLAGIKPNLKRRNSSKSSFSRSQSMKRSMLSSIKEVIREGNKARRLEEQREAASARKNAVDVASKSLSPLCSIREAILEGSGARRLEEERKSAAAHTNAVCSRRPVSAATRGRTPKMILDVEMKRRTEYMKLHPLPLRMPKYAQATTCKAVPCLTLLDDVWDGTVMDAFSKITVTKWLSGNYNITKQHAVSSGVIRIIDVGTSPFKSSKGVGYIDVVRPRVLVASIGREIGQHGIVKGDVVTHFNGEEFKGNATELTELIKDRKEGEMLTFVFNADAAVAEALKRRAVIISSTHH